VDVAAPHFGTVRARARQAVAPDDVVELFAVLVPVLFVDGAGHELRPEESGRAPVVQADGDAKVGDAPAVLHVHPGGLHVVDVDEDAVAELASPGHLEVRLGHGAAELIAGVLDALRADVETDDEGFLVLRLVEEEVLRPLGHETAVACADLGALVPLPDGAVALQINGDLVAVAMEVSGVRGAGPEDGVEEGGGAPVPARDGQPELGDGPALSLLHVLGTDVVNVHQRILQGHGTPHSTLMFASFTTLVQRAKSSLM
jgi:hypothetical protein